MAGSPFIESVRSEIRLRGYSLRTEKTYIYWIKQFIYFHGKRHPCEMGAEEVKAFLHPPKQKARRSEPFTIQNHHVSTEGELTRFHIHTNFTTRRVIPS